MEEKRYIGVEISKTSNILKRNCMNSDLTKKINEATGKNSWIIGFIAQNSNKDVFQRDIEEKFSIRRSTVSSMIKLMEKKGLVVRESVAYDARLKKLTLTPKAWEMHNQMLLNLDEDEKKLKQNLSDEELDNLFKTLEKIRKNAEGEV